MSEFGLVYETVFTSSWMESQKLIRVGHCSTFLSLLGRMCFSDITILPTELFSENTKIRSKTFIIKTSKMFISSPNWDQVENRIVRAREWMLFHKDLYCHLSLSRMKSTIVRLSLHLSRLTVVFLKVYFKLLNNYGFISSDRTKQGIHF